MSIGTIEHLECRRLFAVTAIFVPGTGALSVLGDNANNTITVSRDAAGKILVNGGAVAIAGGTATVANTALIQVFGQGGNDTITLNEANGALPSANLFGGDGNDVLTGGSGNDQLFGQTGNDQILGKGGFDFLFGGTENDVLTGGDADDQVFGESGDDRMIWNPGDDTDLNEGGDGNDTTEVNGGNGAEAFTVTPNGTRVRFDRVSPAPFSVDIGTTENLVLNANGGDDTFDGANGLATLISLSVDGGTGNDTINGGDGGDFLFGGDGNDSVDGNRGNDTALLGTGDDTFQWDPGDGSDVVEGQDGADTMLFNGSNIGEKFDLSANGSRVRFTRDIASIVMDLNDVERIDLTALGGADNITVNDTSSTDLTTFNVELASALPGTGDGADDTVTVNANNANNTIEVLGAGANYSVVGLATVVNVSTSEPTDQLVVKGLGGSDNISAATLPATTVKLTEDGGAGNDILSGGQGDDTLLGGDGNDTVNGRRGDDVALLGAGDDVFIWNPGDGSDVVEGQDGNDKMLFNGSNIGESMDVSANGTRVRFSRNVGNIVMDLNDVETIDVNALDGDDSIVVGDMSGTDLKALNLDLASPAGSGTPDGAADTVTVNGTNSADTIKVSGNTGGVTVSGLTTKVSIKGHEAALDILTVSALGGADKIDASGLAANVIGLTLNGGLDVDTLLGSKGNDLVNGGDGNDVAHLGEGNDTFVWNPGDDSDIVEGQAGTDTMRFNGAIIAEDIEISANGNRVRLTRNVASIVMDLNDVETIDVNALGGADDIVVNNLTGTDVTEVNLNLAASAAGGAGDGAADTVDVRATNGDDVVVVVGDASGVSVLGLAAQVNITGMEAANDRLAINALAGDDVVEASGLAAGALGLVVDGGANDDVIVGSDGDDVLTGGDGDDVIVGGPGIDVIDGGLGDDVEIQLVSPFTPAQQEKLALAERIKADFFASRR